MLQRAIVIGASSGIGAALVDVLAREGYDVAMVARRVEPMSAQAERLGKQYPGRNFLAVAHDVTASAEVEACFEHLCQDLGGLDLVVYAAGVMPRVDESTWDTAIDTRMVATNLIGAMAWLNAAARRFEVAGQGTIAGISSVAGDRGRRGNPAYAASKAALTTWLEAARNRLGQHGVRVVTIKPGPVRTPMTEGLGRLPLIIDADVAAEACWRAIRRGAVTAYVPWQWRPIMAIIRAVPSFIFRRLSF